MEEERDPELRELQEELSKLNSLVKHPGYVDLLKIADQQIDARTQAVFLNPLKAMDEVLEQEFKKGEIAGIKLFREIVGIEIGRLEEDIATKLEELKNVDEISDDSESS